MLSVSQIHQNTPNPPQKKPDLKLKPNTPKKIRQMLTELCAPVPKFLNQKILSSEHSLEIISKIDTWYTLQAFYIPVSQTPQPLLLKSIEEIHFPRLFQLYLQNMYLTNFQSLEWIDAPYLRAIYLMKNPAKSIKPLVKTRFNFLQIIQLDSGLPHSELKHLSRTKMRSKSKVTTQDPKSSYNKNPKDQISSHLQQVIFKLESRSLLVQKILSQKLHKRFSETLTEMNK